MIESGASDRSELIIAVILGGLLPLMVADGPGVDVMRPVAAPVIGGMLTAPLFSLLVVPAIYLMIFGAREPRDRALQAREIAGIGSMQSGTRWM